MTKVTLVLNNKLGLHARPAAELTKVASMFKSNVMLKMNDKIIDAKSVILVMSIGVKGGQELTIMADGIDEKECIQHLSDLVLNDFNKES